MNVYDHSLSQYSVDQLTAALQQQASEIGTVGAIDLFGRPVTEADVAKAMRELARVADVCACEIESRRT